MLSALAAKIKCLAESNKTRTDRKATKRRLHPGYFIPRSADQDRVSHDLPC